MAKKKTPARKKVQSSSVLSAIQVGVKKLLQRDAGTVLSRMRKETTGLARDQRRAADRILSDARKLRADFEKAMKQAAKDLESRSRRFVATLENEIEKRVGPAVQHVTGRDHASRQELHALARRVHELEQIVKQHAHPVAPEPQIRSPAASDEPARQGGVAPAPQEER